MCAILAGPTGTQAMRLVIIGGSDAGISAALRAREIDSGTEVDMIVADGCPRLSRVGNPDAKATIFPWPRSWNP
jgi:NADPH-dependent 2,4-dienoyl-CoA reductase/sulfur reductase-like enzyme